LRLIQLVNQVARARVIQAMSEFATLASPYSMPAATHGDVDLTILKPRRDPVR